MFTGQRIPLQQLAEAVHRRGALLVLDATHAAGVVRVDASCADVVISSCYKWLLGTHGTAVFYWNRKRLPELKAPFLGWASAASAGGWKDPLTLTQHNDAMRFMPANPNYLGIYILHNALKTLLPLGLETIEQHALSLTARLHQGISKLDLDRLQISIMTSAEEQYRAGNICIMSDRVDELSAD